jgi:hypothetical protein
MPGCSKYLEGSGPQNYIIEEMVMDRSGSQILEAILWALPKPLPGYEMITIQNMVAVAAWYIWWMRRRLTHEQIPPVMHCTHSIKAIAANAARANTSTSSQRRRCWTRPLANLVKVNVDAAFSIENMWGYGKNLEWCYGDLRWYSESSGKYWQGCILTLWARHKCSGAWTS